MAKTKETDSNITRFRIDRANKLKEIYADEPSRERRYGQSSRKVT